MDAAELLPCPCCTSAAMFVPKPAKAGHDWQTGYVQCVLCGLRTEGGEARHVAEAAWNRRAEARQAPLQWTREDLAEALALIDGVILQDIKSTVGPAEDANNWRKYLGDADDVLSHLSFIASLRTENAPATPAPLPAETVTEEMVKAALAAQLDVDGGDHHRISNFTMRKYLEAAFAARPAAEPVGVKVKPLEWERGSGNALYAYKWNERYSVHKHDGHYILLINSLRQPEKYETEEAALFAAESHWQQRIRSALVSTTAPGLVEAPTHRHKKRGTEYVLIGIGKMQAADWQVCEYTGTDEPVHGASVDMREVAIYRSATDPTEIWVRPREEFEDGRFEALASITETGGAK